MHGDTWALMIAAGVPALTAITWVAYRHPHAYARFWVPGLLVLTGCTLAAGLAFNAGVTSASDAALDSNLRIPGVVVFGVLPLIMAYIVFLLFLPTLLNEKPEHPRRTNPSMRLFAPPLQRRSGYFRALLNHTNQIVHFGKHLINAHFTRPQRSQSKELSPVSASTRIIQSNIAGRCRSNPSPTPEPATHRNCAATAMSANVKSSPTKNFPSASSAFSAPT